MQATGSAKRTPERSDEDVGRRDRDAAGRLGAASAGGIGSQEPEGVLDEGVELVPVVLSAVGAFDEVLDDVVVEVVVVVVVDALESRLACGVTRDSEASDPRWPFLDGLPFLA